MLTLLSRNDWGAVAASSSGFYMGAAVGFTVHWSGVTKGAYTPNSAIELVRSDQDYHLRNGWRDIAYNFLVDRYGVVYEGRGWDIANGANGTDAANRTSIAVCVVMGPGDEFTAACKQALIELRNAHIARGGTLRVFSHRDHVATQCPGNEVANWVSSVLPMSQLANDQGEDELSAAAEQKITEMHKWIAELVAVPYAPYGRAVTHADIIDAIAKNAISPAALTSVVANAVAAALKNLPPAAGVTVDVDALTSAVTESVLDALGDALTNRG